MALLPNVTGSIDSITNTILPNCTNTWANLTVNNSSSWDELASWITRPIDPLVWLSEPIDLTKMTAFTLQISTVAVGLVNYTVFTSNVGDFPDAHTTSTSITSGSSNIPAFFGRYVTVAAEVTNQGGLHSLDSMQLTAGTSRFEILLNDIDSSTLDGTNNSRKLPIDRAVSKVLHIQLTPHLAEGTVGGSSYTVDDYIVADYFADVLSTFTGAFPQIIDKISNRANVAFVNSQGNFVDCVFDAVAYVYPEQFMDGNDLKVR